MKTTLFQALALAGLLALSAASQAGDISYSLDPISDGGTSIITGTITTDGYLGYLAPSDIVGFDLTVSSATAPGTTLFEISSASGAKVTGSSTEVLSALDASATGLSLDDAFTGSAMAAPTLTFAPGGGSSSFIDITTSNAPTFSFPAGFYWGGPGVSDGFAYYYSNATIATVPTTAVPEPSSLALLGAGLLVALGVTASRARNRRTAIA